MNLKLKMTDQLVKFATAIAPFTPESFFDDYWEKCPLMISNRPANYYGELMNLTDVDRILYSLKPDWKKMRLFKDGHHFTGHFMHPDGTPNITCIHQAYNRGYLLNLLNLESRWLPLAAMVRDWEAQLHHPVSVNLYLTPQHSKAVRPHFDDHDVFILQIEGEKDWKVWQPIVELPGEEFGGNQFLPEDNLPSCFLETRLQAGDLLYLPRGWGHAATTGDRASLHLTFGVFVYTWYDLLDGMLEAISDADDTLNRALPVGFMRDPEAKATMQHHFGKILQNWMQSSQLEAGIDRVGDRLIGQMKDPLPNQYFGNIEKLNHLDSTDRVHKKAGAFFRTSIREHEIILHYPGRQLQLPKSWENALKLWEDGCQVAFRDLPGTKDEKLTVLRHLIGGGVLAIATENFATSSGV